MTGNMEGTLGTHPGHDVDGARVTVVGAMRSGLAAARLLKQHGARVLVTDTADARPDRQAAFDEIGVDIEWGGHSDRAEDCDLMVVSPGVDTAAPVVRRAAMRGTPVISEIELASRYCEAPIVAITGSNGKTTTTTLAGHVIAASGRRTFVAGNIGAPFSDIAGEAVRDDVVVLEVSSFQLDLIERFKPSVAAILNITPDHLDRYGGDFEAYARSKSRIYENQDGRDALITNADDETVTRHVGAAAVRPTHHEISLEREVRTGGFIEGGDLVIRLEDEEMRMPMEEVPLRGRHNLYNSLAAAVAARVMEVRSDVIRESMAGFQGVAHRLELIRSLDGVKYYNDSKATNVNAVWYALESFQEPIILIAGGRDKGNDYEAIRALVGRKVKVLLAIGESAEKVMTELGPEVPKAIHVDSLEDAVRTARVLSREGDVVLLSPACASFDMFENYEERGETFRRLVSSL